MFWQILWALILGFALSAVVQAVVSKRPMMRLLPDDSPRSLAIVCGLGTASSSCSYAAVVALARSIALLGGLFRLFLRPAWLDGARRQAERGIGGPRRPPDRSKPAGQG